MIVQATAHSPSQATETTPVFGVRSAVDAPAVPSLAAQLPSGVLIELSGTGGTARTSTAASLVVQAQAANEGVVWIQPEGGSLFPPDMAEVGVDLDSLVVIHVPEASVVPHHLARGAELLLRSGAFGLVVVDFTEGTPKGDRWPSRLAALARRHDSQVVFLTSSEPSAGSIGAMVSVRLAPRRHRRGPGRFVLEPSILRDKTGRLARTLEPYRGPWGLA